MVITAHKRPDTPHSAPIGHESRGGSRSGAPATGLGGQGDAGAKTASSVESVYTATSAFDSLPVRLDLGPVHAISHESVVICPGDTAPVLRGNDGVVRSNPACDWFGLHPGESIFSREPERHDVVVRSVNVDPSLVRANLTAFDREWDLVHNCRPAVSEVTSEDCGPCKPAPPRRLFMNRMFD
ncbi:MAG: hypothetical protein U0871_01975 [Gemmataceae bacterium]